MIGNEKLKKTILFLLMVASLYADAKVYIGSNLGYFDERFSEDIEAKSSSYMAKIKAGYGDREAYAIEFSLDYYDNKSKIFSQDDSKKFAMNVELVKAFDLNIYVNPFFKAGFGAGYLNVDREFEDILHYGTFNLGAGMFIPVNEHFDFELGYDYKAVSYEGIDTIVQQISYASHMNIVYFGFNLRF
ncbi:porin family protein [bacterium]|nr:porin family protein [bacterium]MBU1990700.1 porin family protein [bacterium]